MTCTGGACSATAYGSACNSDNDCSQPNYCILGYCQELSMSGEACGITSDCVSPYVCTSGVCQ